MEKEFRVLAVRCGYRCGATESSPHYHKGRYGIAPYLHSSLHWQQAEVGQTARKDTPSNNQELPVVLFSK